jgi:hypothetical protein
VRCYLHLIGQDQDLLDQVGVETSSQEEARAEALTAIAEMLREEPSLQRDWNGWSLRIVDETGRCLSTIPLNMFSHQLGRQNLIGRAAEDNGNRRRRNLS